MTLRQLPDFAFRSATDLADQLALMHDRYDPTMGAGVVDLLDRLQLFHAARSQPRVRGARVPYRRAHRFHHRPVGLSRWRGDRPEDRPGQRPARGAGYTFHQNGFGPAPELVIRDAGGQPLWSGPVPMTEQAMGLPYAEMAVPGRDVALALFLQRRSDGLGVVQVLPFRVIPQADGSEAIQALEPLALARGESASSEGTDFSLELLAFSDFTLLIAKHDPGQGIVWTAFGFLIVGLMITFWMPRRRVWARLGTDGQLALVWRADRYVDVVREFSRVLDDLVPLRRCATGPAATA